MRLAAFALLAPVVVAPPAFAEEFACEGPFGIETSAEAMVQAFGVDNVVTGEVPGPEGTTMIATTVYPGDPEREFQAVWWDEQNLKNLSYVTIPAGVSVFGLELGMGLEEVEAVNGEPFELTGFYWDYGGSGWFQSGALADIAGGCTVSFSFSPTADLPEGVSDEPIVGDRIIRSDLPLLRQVEPVLAEILVGYPYDAFPQPD